MRGKVELMDPPQGLATELYLVAKPKPPKLTKITPDDVVGDQITAVAKLVTPDIWFDPVIFPSTESIWRALATLTEPSSSVSVKPARYVVDMEGSVIAVREVAGQTARVVAKGTSGDIYAFFSRYAPGYLDTLRKFSETRIVHENDDDLSVYLDKARAARAFSSALDRTSKLAQLGRLDQDHTVNKFWLAPDEPVHECVVHFGAGTASSSSQRWLRVRYKEVHLVDPRLSSGPGMFPMTYQEYKIRPGFDIVSDVAYGDAKGFTSIGQKALVEYLYKFSAERLVICKWYLQRGVNARGFVRKKPRPHNLELIIELHPDGDPLDDIYDEWDPKIREANEKRNERVFKMTPGEEVLKTFNNRFDLRLLIEQPLYGVRIRRDFVRADRNYALVNGGTSPQRRKEWRVRCNSSAKAMVGGCILPLRFSVDRTSLYTLDPNIGSVEFSFSSVFRTAEARGYVLEYRRGMWRMK